ncbi:glycosyltransferase family 2 protein [Nibribacter koreensis]|uniref:Glycosyltransferase family 2 protein n=1 Tax=Nibribacter koreensis TaxID=1084519 RepID=A0ABP8F4T2_9BACT
MRPKISVLVAVYNLEFYIERCLESLAKQTLKEIEVLVINDGGSDESQLIIDEYVVNYPSIFKSFIKENGGHGSSLNYGIERATGEYLMIVDGDDFLDEDTCEFMYDKAKEKDVDMVMGNLFYIFPDSTLIFKPVHEDSELLIEGSNKSLLFRNWATPCARIYRRELFEDPELRFVPGIVFADANFAPKSYHAAKSIYYVNKNLYNYDITRPTQSMKLNNVKILDIITGMRDMLQYYKNKGEFDLYKTELQYYVGMHCLAWVNKIKFSEGFSRSKALRELFKVADDYFGDSWLQDKNIKTLRGRKAYHWVRLGRMTNYYSFIVAWRLAQKSGKFDQALSKAFKIPLSGYSWVSSKVQKRLNDLLYVKVWG